MSEVKEEKSLGRKILEGILLVIGGILAIVAVFILVLTVTEYRPADEETLTIEGDATESLNADDSFTIMSWNIGYGGLSSNADFFMDGGEDVTSCDKDQVEANIEGIASTIASYDPDALFLQEADSNSKRSYYINEREALADCLGQSDTTYAYNYRCLYVPYPIPTIGRVNCGIMTASKYDITGSTRVQLPCPFTWPTRLANLKRCLMVDRIALDGTDKELVLVNVHLEAYSDTVGQKKQTAMLAEVLQKEVDAGNYVIAGGDFNQTFEDASKTYPTLGDNWESPVIYNASFGDDFSLLMDDSVPSCRLLDQPFDGADPDTVQYYMLDGFIVSSNLDVVSMETLDEGFQYTDHNPIRMTVNFK